MTVSRETLLHALIWAGGAVAWTWFLGFGAIPFGLWDWRVEHFIHSVMALALRSGEIPWHVQPPFLYLERWLAMPMSVLAPQVLLLRWLSIPAFVMVHILGCYTVGYLGCARLAARYRLAWPAFLALILLFNFNGYPVSHLCVGHLVWWTGYILLPWLWAPLLRWVEGGPNARVCAEICLVIFAMSVFGSFHTCIWSALFVCFLGLRRTGWLLPALAVTAGVGALLAYRLLPGLVGFGQLDHGYPRGYPSLGDLVAGLVDLRPPTSGTLLAMGWWEFDMYLGPAGLAFLVWFGVRPLVVRRAPARTALDLPLAALLLLSYDDVYWWVCSDFPVLAVERVVTRLLVIPLSFLALLAAMQWSEERRSKAGRRWSGGWIAAGLVLLGAPLLVHLALWRPGPPAIVKSALDLPTLVPAIVQRPDELYRIATYAGAGITLTALAVTVWLYLRPPLRPAKLGQHGIVIG